MCACMCYVLLQFRCLFRPVQFFGLCIRSINNVLGFSRETLVAVIANIESREWRRIENIRNKRKPEHPRASSTDDVKCFFSIMRDSIEKNFTTKQVKVGFRKACLEFTKRLDPDLPFFLYHTSSHTHFYEGPLPDFSEAPEKQKKEKGSPGENGLLPLHPDVLLCLSVEVLQ